MRNRVAASLGITAAAMTVAAFTANGPRRILDRYDHISTGFVLDGRHAEITCESCHGGAIFTGTPRTCSTCHNNVRAEGKTTRHIPTANQCQTCHSTRDWLTARFDHTGVVTNCVSCHNNFNAPGKTANHPATGNLCADCHRSTHWNDLLIGRRGT